MWTQDFTYSLTDVNAARLLVAADAYDVQLEVTYLGAKTGVPRSGGSTVVWPAVLVPAHTTMAIPIDLSHPAFAGGYGAVRARSVAGQKFLALSGEGDLPETNPVSGAGFVGTKFRLALFASDIRQGQTVHVATTNVGGIATNVQIASPDGSFGSTTTVAPQETLFWDAAAQGQDFVSGGQVGVVSLGNVPLVVGAFVLRDGVPGHVHLPAAV